MKNYFKFLISLVITISIITSVNGHIIQAINENKTTAQETDRLQRIKQKGVLTVLSPNEEPYSYKDPRSGTFRGLDADIIREAARRFGAKEVNVRYVAFPNAIEEFVNNADMDLFAQGIYITDERKKLVNFTNSIYTEREAILTRQDSGINSKDDLKNKIIGFLGGSVYETMAQQWKQQGLIKDYMPFFDFNSLQIELESKIVDAILTDSIIAENSLLTKPKSKFKILSPSQYKSEINFSVGYPVKKEDVSLLNEINEKLQEMRSDGTIYEILAKYGLVGHYIK